MAAVTIEVLGAFLVTVDGARVDEQAWRHRRGADLVKLLVLAHGRRLHREQLMEALWPELPPEAAGANLRKAIYLARRALGWEDAVRSDGGIVELLPDDDVQVDADAFEAAARQARRAGDASAYALAANRYSGELLPDDRYAFDTARERLRVTYREMLRAGRLWARLLEEDRADEEAHRALMEEALARGDRHAVIRQFERMREALRADIGLGPDAASIEVYEKALTMEGKEPPTPVEQARGVLARALVAMGGGDLDDAERLAEEARTLAVSAASGREVGEASALLGMVALQRGRWKELFRSEFVASLRRPPPLASAVFDAHICLADFSLYGAQGHEELAPFARELLALAEDAGSIHGQAVSLLLLGEIELLSGRLGQAGDHLVRSRDLHRQAGAESGRVLAIERLAETALAGGKLAHAGRILRTALPMAQSSPLWPHLLPRVLGGLIEAAGDAARAEAALRRADDSLARKELCKPCSMGYRIAATKVLAHAGDLEHATLRLAEAERIAGMWQGGPWLAAVWEARGTLRRAEGNEAQAIAMFSEAAELFERAGRRLDQARCRAAVGATAG